MNLLLTWPTGSLPKGAPVGQLRATLFGCVNSAQDDVDHSARLGD